MPYNPHIHHRRSIRLKGYDYSQAGLYFITVCVHHRECLFGEIIVNEQSQGIAPTGMDAVRMILNQAGKMVKAEWLALPNRFDNVHLREYIVMPNHFHGILEIVNNGIADIRRGDPGGRPLDEEGDPTKAERISDEGRPPGYTPTMDAMMEPTGKTVGNIMSAFKSITTVEYIRGVKEQGWQPFNGKLWQRDYYEHIIRNEQAYENISNYIINNPAKWQEDKFYTGQ